MKIILCPITDRPEKIPGHQLFGSSYFEEVADEVCASKVKVEYLIYKQGGYGLLRTIILNISLAFRIMARRHDALYFRIDPDPLLLLSLLRFLGIYRHPIYAWKYTSVDRTGNAMKDFVKRMLHRGFTKIFMVTESHVPKTISEGILRPEQVAYVKWGEDLNYVDRFKTSKHERFTFITTGKAHRDMRTLCEAFTKAAKKSHEAIRLKIFTVRRWADYDYTQYLDHIGNPDIEVTYSDEICLEKDCGSVLDQLFKEMHRSHCALSVCHQVKFGVGYTQVLDSLACGIPIIATANPDNPIDIDGEQCGITVGAGDVDALAEAMTVMADDNKRRNSMGENGRRLIEREYDIRQTAGQVLRHFFIYD